MSAPEAGVATVGISGGIPPASMGERGAEPLNLVGGESPNSSHGGNGGADGLSTPVM